VQEDAVHGHVFHKIIERSLQGRFQIEAAAYERCHLTKEFVFNYVHVSPSPENPLWPPLQRGQKERTVRLDSRFRGNDTSRLLYFAI
jgi:hypothetical protein